MTRIADGAVLIGDAGDHLAVLTPAKGLGEPLRSRHVDVPTSLLT